MGRGKTKLVLEDEGGDDDVLAAAGFDAAPQRAKKRDSKRASKSSEDNAEEDSSSKAVEAREAATSRPPSEPKRKKLKEPVPSESQDDTGEDGKKKYERLILFVGQIPFEAASADIEQHFADHGAGKVKVRLLTEKGTGKSRGMAFVDFESPQQLVRGLRVHHTRLMGRAINVERTVGGGGNNPVRKEKLAQLREFQGSRVKREVQELVSDALKRSNGLLTTRDADELVIQSLCVLPRDAAKQILDEILESDIARAKNKKAWILGFIKRYTARLKTGEQFLKLEEEKAGIIEKRKPSNRGKPEDTRHVSGGRSSAGGSREDSRTPVQRPGPFGSRASASGGPSSGAAKFKRGMIGQA